jgi:hypothetical protein
MTTQRRPALLRRTRAIDLTGRSFFRLTALCPTEERRGGSVVWHCRCACGRPCKVAAGKLLASSARSCGCLRRGRTAVNAARDAAMRRERAEGMTFGQLAARYGVSRQRVHQVVRQRSV